MDIRPILTVGLLICLSKNPTQSLPARSPLEQSSSDNSETQLVWTLPAHFFDGLGGPTSRG